MPYTHVFRDFPYVAGHVWETRDDWHFTSLHDEHPQENSDKLVKVLKLRDECVYIKSNELNKPLASLRHLLSTTQKKQEEGSITSMEMGRRLTQAEYQSRKLGELITDLIDLSRVDSKCQLNVRLQESNLCNVAAEVVNRFVDEAIENKCELILDCPDIVIGEWDPARLDQLITNLVSNAIKYAPGSIIEVKIFKNVDHACIEVCDHGPGIPFGKQSKIFERFTKLDESKDGFGIGLWHVKEIAERFSGTVKLASWPGEGATFTVVLPLRQLLH